MPVSIDYTFEVGDLLNRDGDRARIRPLWSEFDWTALAVTEKRRFDIMVGSPSKTVTTAVVKLPPTGIALEEIERQALVEALRMSNWVQKDAAELLHISPRVMNYKIKVLGIELPRSRRAAVVAEAAV